MRNESLDIAVEVITSMFRVNRYNVTIMGFREHENT